MMSGTGISKSHARGHSAQGRNIEAAFEEQGGLLPDDRSRIRFFSLTSRTNGVASADRGEGSKGKEWLGGGRRCCCRCFCHRPKKVFGDTRTYMGARQEAYGNYVLVT